MTTYLRDGSPLVTPLTMPVEWGAIVAEWDLEPEPISTPWLFQTIAVLVAKIIYFLTFNYSYYSDLKERVSLYKQYEQNVRDRQELDGITLVEKSRPFFSIGTKEKRVSLSTDFGIPHGWRDVTCHIEFTQAFPETDPQNKRLWERDYRLYDNVRVVQKTKEIVTFDQVKEEVKKIHTFCIFYDNRSNR